MLRRFRGSLDEGNRQFVRGWAASGRRPLDVTVVVRGSRFTVTPNEERPDLVPLGLPARSGFMFIFPEPLSDGDAVHVYFPNGTEIQKSPFVYSRDELAAVINGSESAAFNTRYPSHQNAVDIFRDAWASSMPAGSGLETSGADPHFEDQRTAWGASVLGSLKGRSILELGPLEAYNSYQLEQLGAQVLAIEANVSNFLKCLVVKNALGMSTTFLLGDFVQFLESCSERFDVCWASGVLYHAKDPIALLKGACRVAPTVFLWTHYFDESIIARSPEQLRFFRSNLDKRVKAGDREIVLHYRSYVQKKGRLFTGGPDEYSFWMSRDDIIAILTDEGLGNIVIGGDDPQLSRGPACFLMASRLPLPQQPV